MNALNAEVSFIIMVRAFAGVNGDETFHKKLTPVMDTLLPNHETHSKGKSSIKPGSGGGEHKAEG
jgi:hypothetical protein